MVGIAVAFVLALTGGFRCAQPAPRGRGGRGGEGIAAPGSRWGGGPAAGVARGPRPLVEAIRPLGPGDGDRLAGPGAAPGAGAGALRLDRGHPDRDDLRRPPARPPGPRPGPRPEPAAGGDRGLRGGGRQHPEPGHRRPGTDSVDGRVQAARPRGQRLRGALSELPQGPGLSRPRALRLPRSARSDRHPRPGQGPDRSAARLRPAWGPRPGPGDREARHGQRRLRHQGPVSRRSAGADRPDPGRDRPAGRAATAPRRERRCGWRGCR